MSNQEQERKQKLERITNSIQTKPSIFEEKSNDLNLIPEPLIFQKLLEELNAVAKPPMPKEQFIVTGFGTIPSNAKHNDKQEENNKKNQQQTNSKLPFIIGGSILSILLLANLEAVKQVFESATDMGEKLYQKSVDRLKDTYTNLANPINTNSEAISNNATDKASQVAAEITKESLGKTAEAALNISKTQDICQEWIKKIFATCGPCPQFDPKACHDSIDGAANSCKTFADFAGETVNNSDATIG